MCGRIALSETGDTLALRYHLAAIPRWHPRYNIPPSHSVLTLTMSHLDGIRTAHLRRWGLIPAWAKDPGIGAKMINARAETVEEKPSFRRALRSRRTVILADGFYEWTAASGRKEAWAFRRPDAAPFALAGLWERWQPPDGGDPLETCTIITTEANDLMRPIHHRMPVIIAENDLDLWLDSGVQEPARVRPLLAPPPVHGLVAFPVNPAVNRPVFDSPECLVPIGPVRRLTQPVPA